MFLRWLACVSLVLADCHFHCVTIYPWWRVNSWEVGRARQTLDCAEPVQESAHLVLPGHVLLVPTLCVYITCTGISICVCVYHDIFMISLLPLCKQDVESTCE